MPLKASFKKKLSNLWPSQSNYNKILNIQVDSPYVQLQVQNPNKGLGSKYKQNAQLQFNEGVCLRLAYRCAVQGTIAQAAGHKPNYSLMRMFCGVAMTLAKHLAHRCAYPSTSHKKQQQHCSTCIAYSPIMQGCASNYSPTRMLSLP